MSVPVKVYLLDIEPDGRRLFYIEPVDGDDASELPRHEGFRGWVEAKLRNLRATIHDSENSAARFSKKVWVRLQRTTHPDEALLARLRSTKSINIHHPTVLSHDEVLAAWSLYLSRSRRRHWLWFLVSLIASPVTLLLTPIPGPNLIGYWIAYRAIHHGLILLGLGQTETGQIEMRFEPDDSLNQAIKVSEAVPRGEAPEAVEEFLRRHGMRPR